MLSPPPSPWPTGRRNTSSRRASLRGTRSASSPVVFRSFRRANTGIAFSLFDNPAAGRTSPILIAFTIGVLAMVAWLLWQAIRPDPVAGEAAHWSYRAALALVLGGAAGNLYDRLVSGTVHRLPGFLLGTAHFPVFNVATRPSLAAQS